MNAAVETSARLYRDDGSRNLFVRLSPDVLSELTTSGEMTPSFLPLAVITNEKTIYTSFNGGLLEETTGTIQIPSALLEGLDPASDYVRLRVLTDTQQATSVNVDPCSSSDWELLQAYAVEFEEGHLLNQVSLVSVDQEVALKIRHDTIHIRIKEISLSDTSSPWPSLRTEQTQVAILGQDTELIVTPKPRTSSNALKLSSEELTVIHGRKDMSNWMIELAERLGETAVSVLPGTICVHPQVVNETGAVEWVRLSTPSQEDSKTMVMRVKTSTDLAQNTAVLHPWIRQGLGILFGNSITLCPADAPATVDAKQIDILPVDVHVERHFLFGNYTALSDEFATETREDAFELPVNSLIGVRPSAPDAAQGSNRTAMSYFRLARKDSFDKIYSNSVVLISVADIQKLRERLENSTVLESLLSPVSDDGLPKPVSCIFNHSIELAEKLLRFTQVKGGTLGTVHGPVGSGKTHSLLVTAAVATIEYGLPVQYVSCKKLCESNSTLHAILSSLESIFQKASSRGKSLILFDDMEYLVPNASDAEGNPGSRVQVRSAVAFGQSKLIADYFIQLWKSFDSDKTDISIVCSCANQGSTNPEFYNLQLMLDLPTLKAHERLELFSNAFGSQWVQNSDSVNFDFGLRTSSFRPLDLEKAGSRAKLSSAMHGIAMTPEATVETVLRSFIPLSHLSLRDSNLKERMSWSQLGGLFGVKKKLEETMLFPTLYRPIYERAQIQLPRGVLLFGPTGCGKSALVPAIATRCNFPLICCRGPEILDKYIGASEAKVRDLFDRAATVAPSILFLDELDALAPRRGSDHTGVTDRVVNQLLTFLDGVERNSESEVFIIAASSRPDKIDPALLRPGRLEEHLFVGPPETESEWVDLLKKVSSDFALSGRCREKICTNECLLNLVGRLQDMGRLSPADLRAAYDTAHIIAVHRHLESSLHSYDEDVEIEFEDLIMAISGTKPCVKDDDAKALDEIYNRYRKRHGDGQKNPTPNLKTTLR